MRRRWQALYHTAGRRTCARRSAVAEAVQREAAVAPMHWMQSVSASYASPPLPPSSAAQYSSLRRGGVGVGIEGGGVGRWVAAASGGGGGGGGKCSWHSSSNPVGGWGDAPCSTCSRQGKGCSSKQRLQRALHVHSHRPNATMRQSVWPRLSQLCCEEAINCVEDVRAPPIFLFRLQFPAAPPTALITIPVHFCWRSTALVRSLKHGRPLAAV